MKHLSNKLFPIILSLIIGFNESNAQTLILTSLYNGHEIKYQINYYHNRYTSYIYYSSQLINKLDLDTSITDFRIKMGDTVRLSANNYLSSYTQTQAQDYVNAINLLITNITDTISSGFLQRQQYQNLFYHFSVFESILRAKQNQKAFCSSTVYKGYIVNKSPFICEEDIIYVKNDLINVVSSKPGKMTYLHEQGFLPYLQQEIRLQISLADIRVSYTSYKMAHGYDTRMAFPGYPCPWMSGGECGCCGNYNGVCWWCSFECWIHDMLCQKCTPKWFCFDKCVPGPCY